MENNVKLCLFPTNETGTGAREVLPCGVASGKANGSLPELQVKQLMSAPIGAMTSQGQSAQPLKQSFRTIESEVSD